MTTKQAYQLGVESGYEAGIYGEFTDEQLTDQDEFITEASEICGNKRQYADSPTYEFSPGSSSDALYDAFDEGETVGMRKAWRKLAPERRKAEARQELADAIQDSQMGQFDGVKVADLGQIPRSFVGMVLHVNDHGNCALYHKSLRKFKLVADCV